MIAKYILLALFIFAIYYFFFKKKSIFKKNDKSIKAQDMVKCETCSVFTSQNESILKDGRFYCSKKCAGL